MRLFLTKFARDTALPISKEVIAAAGKKPLPEGVKEVDAQNFDEVITNSNEACLVYFTTL